MNEHDSNKNAAASTAAETRVSTLVGDRFCIRCGYNLTGQPVVREPHYHMLIVRCPECGTVASVQEYPLLGRWASRWAALLAAMWFIVILGFACATAGIMCAFSWGTGHSAALEYAKWLAERQQAWQLEQKTAGIPPNPNVAWMLGQPPSADSLVDPTWWAAQDPATLLTQAGGWWVAADWTALLTWITTALVIFPLGCSWAVAMMKLRWRGFMLLAFVIAAMAVVFVLLTSWSGNVPSMGFGWWAMSNVAQQQIGVPFVVMTLAVTMLSLFGGMLVGRPLVRLLIRALLPPRLRSSLALLWIADGLEPPSTRR